MKEIFLRSIIKKLGTKDCFEIKIQKRNLNGKFKKEHNVLNKNEESFKYSTLCFASLLVEKHFWNVFLMLEEF